MLLTRSSGQDVITQFFELADVKINGSRPWDIQVNDDRFYKRVLQHESLGFGESYSEGWWDTDQLDELANRVLRAKLHHQLKNNGKLYIKILLHRLINYQNKRRSKQVAKQHYDLDNDLFQKMLDKDLIYSCAYWTNATCLDTAQKNKLDLICQKLQLRPGMRLLDIGCGWGGLAKFAAQNYGVAVVGITISEKQKELADQRCQGLPISIRLQDYRDLNEQFDRIVSVGMFEHVGHKNYQQFMKVANRCLSDEGLFLLHTIGGNYSEVTGEEWMLKYIFPNGMFPSISQIGKAIEGHFVMEDWHNFGPHYDKTLLAWHERFNHHWSSLQGRYDTYFRRMWNYYLLSCAGLFRSRTSQLWQIVLSKSGVPGGHEFRYGQKKEIIS